MLYIADEVFFVGTAVEVTPIRSVDHIQVGKGSRRPNHPQASRTNSSPSPAAQTDRHNWLTPVNASTPPPVTSHAR